MKGTTLENNNTYWATRKDDFAKEILAQFENYQNWGYTSGYFSRIKTCYDMFYASRTPGAFGLEKDDELTHLGINNFKSLLQRLHILVTQNKFDIDVLSTNSDVASQIDSDIGRGLITHYIEHKELGKVFSDAALTALVCHEAWVLSVWEYSRGAEQDIDEEGNPRREGDQAYYIGTAYDVARSTGLVDSDWYVFRRKVNKWTRAAQYPKHRDAIINSSASNIGMRDYWLDPTMTGQSALLDDADVTYEYLFFHAPTDALPKGRQCLVIGSELLEDDDLIYQQCPLFKLSAGSVLQTTLSDSPATSLVSLQQAIDKIASGLTTNAMNTSVKSIWTPDPNVKVKDGGEQLKFVISGQKPEILDFSNGGDGAYKALEMYLGQQQILSGVNDAARGDAGKAQSGKSLNLMLAVAVQYVQDLQRSYERLASNITTQTIQNTKDFLKYEKMAYIVGKARDAYVMTYTADTLKGINRIKCTLGNPALQSYAGRWELLQQMLQYQVIKDPNAIVAFLRTGDLKVVTDDGFNDSLTIDLENEMLKRGIVPPVMLTDNHAQHIMGNRAVLDDPAARNNPMIVQAVTAHTMEHLRMYQSMPPDLAAILQLPPLPSHQAPPPGPGGGSAPAAPSQMDAGMDVANAAAQGQASIDNAVNDLQQGSI